MVAFFIFISHLELYSRDTLSVITIPEKIEAALDWNDTLTVVFFVRDTLNRPRNSELIIYDSMKDETIETETNDFGFFEYLLKIPFGITNGEYEIAITPKRNTFESKTHIMPVTVFHEYLKLSIVVSPMAEFFLSKGESVKYEIMIQDTTGALVETPEIVINSSKLDIDEILIPDSTGKSEFIFNVEENSIPGEAEIFFHTQKFGYTNSDTLIRKITIMEDTWVSGGNEQIMIVNNSGFIEIKSPPGKIQLFDLNGREIIIDEEGGYLVTSQIPAGAYFLIISLIDRKIGYPVLILN